MLPMIREIGVPDVYFENQLHMKALKAQRAPAAGCQVDGTVVAGAFERRTRRATQCLVSPDPTRQGGGVMSDMGCHCLAVGWHVLTPPGKPVRFCSRSRLWPTSPC